MRVQMKVQADRVQNLHPADQELNILLSDMVPQTMTGVISELRSQSKA